MSKIKWYQWINPLFWIEAYVSMAVYQASRGLIRNVTGKIMGEHFKPTQTTIVVCPNGEHNKDLTENQK